MTFKPSNIQFSLGDQFLILRFLLSLQLTFKCWMLNWLHQTCFTWYYLSKYYLHLIFNFMICHFRHGELCVIRILRKFLIWRHFCWFEVHQKRFAGFTDKYHSNEKFFWILNYFHDKFCGELIDWGSSTCKRNSAIQPPLNLFF